MFSGPSYPYNQPYYSRKGQIIQRKLVDPPLVLTPRMIEIAERILRKNGDIPSTNYPDPQKIISAFLLGSVQVPLSSFTKYDALKTFATSNTPGLEIICLAPTVSGSGYGVFYFFTPRSTNLNIFPPTGGSFLAYSTIGNTPRSTIRLVNIFDQVDSTEYSVQNNPTQNVHLSEFQPLFVLTGEYVSLNYT